MTGPAIRRLGVAAHVVAAHPVLREEIRARFADVCFNDSGRRLAGRELIDFLADCDGAIIALETIDDAILKALPALRVIGKYGVGLDRIDLRALSRRDIRLGWTGGCNAQAVAELGLGLMLCCLRAIPQMSTALREGRWSPTRGRSLESQTIGLIGCGHIGQAMARMLRSLGCRVFAHDIRPLVAFCAETGVEQVALDALLEAADIISLHLPLTPVTRRMFDAPMIARLKADAILINTARGELVDHDALKAALVGGRLAAAGCDVFDPEPPVDVELLELPNFIGTPHVGASTAEAVLACGRAAVAGLSEQRRPADFIPVWAWS